MLVGSDWSSKLDCWSLNEAMIEAAAIVEAEWVRLRPSRGPVDDVACDRPAPRPHLPRARTLVTTKPTPRARPIHAGELRLRWPVRAVWARERSPPAPTRRTADSSPKGGELRELKDKQHQAVVPSTNIATHSH
jgi:hypothetical protein